MNPKDIVFTRDNKARVPGGELIGHIHSAPRGIHHKDWACDLFNGGRSPWCERRADLKRWIAANWP